MSKTEELPNKQPADIEVDGEAHYTGVISATLDQALLMQDTQDLHKKQARKDDHRIHVGTPGELVFPELFDGKGKPLRVGITIAAAKDGVLTLDFRKQGSSQVRTLLKILKSPPKSNKGHYQTDSVLAELRKRSLNQLDHLIDDFFMGLIDHLFDTSARPQSGHRQELFYESMNLVKKNRDKMREDYLTLIDSYFDASKLDPTATPQDPGDLESHELNLVDINDFEESLSMQRVIKRGQERYAAALECLLIRFAELVDQPPLETRLPIDIAQLCDAFRRTLDARAISHEAGPEIYAYFTANVIETLETYYSSLNVFLRDHGVNPDIEAEVEKHGSVLKKPTKAKIKKSGDSKKEKPPTPEEAMVALAEESARLQEEARRSGFDLSSGNPDAGSSGAKTGASSTAQDPGSSGSGGAGSGGAGGSGGGQAGGGAHQPITDDVVSAIRQQFQPDSLYSSVVNALNFKRESQATAMRAAGHRGPIADGTAPPGATPADTTALANALSALQQDSEARTQVSQTASLRKFLSDNQGSIGGLEGTTGFEPESLNQLELVDNLFTDIRTDVDVAPDLRPSLGNLQIPLAKLALLEPQFFQEKEHPARGVVDKVAQLASSANYPNKALENKVSGVIDNIVDNYQADSNVFENALSVLDKLVYQQEKALERNVERVVKTQDGQEKLRKANAAVDKVLRKRIRPPYAPKPIVDLVQNGWRDLLVLTHVKDGPNSRAWKDYTKTLDLLSLWLLEQSKGASAADIQVERGLEAEPFVDMVRQQIVTGLPTNVAHEPVLDELLEVLSGRAEVEQAEIAPYEPDTRPKPAEVRKKVETLPRLRRWVKRVEELKTGSWLNYKDKNGAKRRMQLAWVSEDKDRFIFVNERGQKLSELSNIELARQLSRGVQPRTEADELSLVDQSMYNTLEEAHKTLSFANNHDALTKLINKKTFMAQLERALDHAKTRKSEHGLLLLDIDNFSLVNELYDEITGDQVLTEFGKLLAQLHDEKVSSSRMDGDQFGVLLHNTSQEDAVVFAESLRREVEKESLGIESDEVSFTISVGITNIVEHSDTVESILENAQTAVAKAKDDGRNKVVQFHEDQSRAEQYVAEERAAKKEIKETFETDSFVLQAQPIVRAHPDNQDEKVRHYEILLAIKDGNKLKSPQDFIINAERFGYMVDVDRWVVTQVFTWINELMDVEKEIPYLSINLSGTSVTDDTFMEYLFEQISEFGVGTDRICFEITETGTISNMIKAADFVREFKNIGCKFSIDDFGTGLASHNYLRELPVDYLKIDGTFISKLHLNDNDYAMVKSINDLAHFLGQETIAEFVENDEIIAKLQEIGVDYLQGWGVGRPAPLSELADQMLAVEK
jgi:diguanylate cyclase (GGDEF)-like protein